MFCSNCGKEVPNDAVFCPECGTEVRKPAPQPIVISEPVVSVPEPVPDAPEPKQTPSQADDPAIPEENRPLSPWAYFGFRLLFMIPVIGFILLIVFSFAGKNVNRKNFARSYWCMYIVILGIVLILLVLIITGILRGTLEGVLVWLRDVCFPWLSGVLG